MPRIVVAATLAAGARPSGVQPIYTFSASLTFDRSVSPYGRNTGSGGRDREIYSLPGRPESTENTWVIDFPQLRGGALTVGVTVRVGAASPPLTATLSGLTIVGTNPRPAQIKAFANSIGATNQRFRKIMRQESSLSQFTSAGWPKFSADGRGGVGLCQVTIPTPTDDQIWNWKENVRQGWRIYQEKERIARRYSRQMGRSAMFRAAVAAWNNQRIARGQPSIDVLLLEYTQDQLELDTVRGYNGYGNPVTHEFRFRIAPRNGELVVTLDPAGRRGVAEWERVPVADRPPQGDRNYVDHVDNQPDF